MSQPQGLGWIKTGCAVASNFSTVTFCGGLLDGNRNRKQSNPTSDSALAASVCQSKNDVSKQVMQYDGKSWKAFSAMTERRYGAVAVHIENRLFVFGGETSFNMNSTILQNFEEFQDNMWKVKGDLLQPRTFGSVQAVGGKAYLLGGYSSPTLPQQFKGDPGNCATSSCEAYDPETNLFSPCVPLNQARAKFGSAAVASKIYVVGGVSERGNVQTMEFLDTYLEYDQWTIIHLSDVDRYLGETSACFLDDKIYIYSKTSNVVYIYNTVNKYWTTDFQPPPLSGHLVSVLR